MWEKCYKCGLWSDEWKENSYEEVLCHSCYDPSLEESLHGDRQEQKIVIDVASLKTLAHDVAYNAVGPALGKAGTFMSTDEIVDAFLARIETEKMKGN